MRTIHTIFSVKTDSVLDIYFQVQNDKAEPLMKMLGLHSYKSLILTVCFDPILYLRVTHVKYHLEPLS